MVSMAIKRILFETAKAESRLGIWYSTLSNVKMRESSSDKPAFT